MVDGTRSLNENVFAGLAGGLFVYWANLATKEFMKILDLPDNYIIQMFVGLAFALFIFVVFMLMNLAISFRK